MYCTVLCCAGLTLLVDSQGPAFPLPLPATFTFSNSTGGVLDCPATGDPAPALTWVLGGGGGPLPAPPGLAATLANGSLQLLPFPAAAWRSDLHDVAVRCRASNTHGTALSTLVHIRGGENPSLHNTTTLKIVIIN